MKKIRTIRFFKAFYTSAAFSAAFLLWLTVFGRGIAVNNFDSMMSVVFAVLALAACSFLVFCFTPYFQGDKRWFAIPSMLTVVFFIGTAILWQVPVGGGLI